MSDTIYIEVIDQHSKFEGKLGKIVDVFDYCGIMIIELFEENKIIFLDEKQYRIICVDEYLWRVYYGNV